MSATDELRRMLDERGEYYQTSGNRTWWGRPVDARTGNPINVFHNQAQPMGDDRLFVELQLATPEKAVEATLGGGTCHNDSLKCGEGVFLCSECGVYLDIADMNEEDMDVFYEPRFCPNCGAKVVDE